MIEDSIGVFTLISVAIVIGVSLVVATIMSIIFKDKEKVDQGFTMLYYRLSYRRKFKRTLWMLPALFIAGAIIFWLSNWSTAFNSLIISLLIVVYTSQLIYTYIKWKRSESEEHELHHE